MGKKLVVGNWKMYGNSIENEQLLNSIVAGLTGLQIEQCAVCVPYPYLPSVQNKLNNTNISWGAQNVSQYQKGAYTGEVSTSMLNDFGCTFVIIGHSERRSLFGENNDIVAEKYVAAQGGKLTPILCVGETLEQRERGITEQIIQEQLMTIINKAGVESLSKAVVAYEPVWAIGTGKTAAPNQAQEVHTFIRNSIGTQDMTIAKELTILYGGSVKANNAAELFAMPDIDGGLIGGASLVADDFVAICNTLNN